MHIAKVFLTVVALGFGANAALASMVWSGVAIDPALVKRVKSDENFLDQLLSNPPPSRSVYLDKAWHGIHFLLTGSTDSTGAMASKVIFGGESVGPDQGYGPAQLLTSAEVKAIAELLSRETPERLAARYESKALERAEIYPKVIWVREGPDALKYVLDYYDKLVKFYQQAAKNGDAVVFVIH